MKSEIKYEKNVNVAADFMRFGEIQRECLKNLATDALSFCEFFDLVRFRESTT